MAGISEKNRKALARLHSSSSGLIDTSDVVNLLKLDRGEASKFLSYLSRQGWARRVGKGTYLLIPLEASTTQAWSEDSWILAHRLYSPGYIAGWTATEFWGLTEQIFRDICVFTTARIRERQVSVDGTKFVLRKISQRRLYGLHSEWRKDVRIEVSDATKTLIDILDPPKWGGGIRHVSHVLGSYLDSEFLNYDLMVSHLEHARSGAIAKRLGYLLENHGIDDPALLESIRSLMTEGYALLDPSLPSRGKYVARWRLRVNAGLIE
ncbi:MAG: type IV toxin-antitoxin system AbiEi family antitoxin domain-containing protein [Anaerolineales bacterium]